MKRLLALAILASFFIYAGETRAQSGIAALDVPPEAPPNNSIQWLAMSRPAIALEDVTSSTPAVNPQTNNVELTIQTHLKETLKGQPPQDASFVRRWQEGAPEAGGAIRPENGTEYLMFFDAGGKVTNAINLKFPSRKLGVGVDPGDVAVSSDFTVLKSGDVIEDTVRRQLALVPPNVAALPPKQIEIPIDTPAWAVFYDGGTPNLMVPDDSQSKTAEAPVARKVEFSGPAYSLECQRFPVKAFEIKSSYGREPHTASIACADYPDSKPEPKNMTVTFIVNDIVKEADYDFDWGSNPDVLPARKAFFLQERDCRRVARILQVRVPHDPVPLVPVSGTADSQPLIATWTAECVPSQAWQFSIALELHVRYAPKEGVKNAPVPENLPGGKPL